MSTQNLIITPQLAAILDAARRPALSIRVDALAGCGKTTAGIALCKVLAGRIFFGSFTNTITREIEHRLSLSGITPGKVTTATFNAMGYRAWKSFTRNNGLTPDADKCSNLLSEIIENGDRRLKIKVKAVRRKNILSLVSFAKQQCLGVGDKKELDSIPVWSELACRYGLDEELSGASVEDLAEIAIQVFDESLTRVRSSIDFDDQLFAPLFHLAPFPVFDAVITDEAQDQAENRRLLAMRMVRPVTGRIIAIGDQNQAIMRFAGADSDAMDRIELALSNKGMKSVRLPLSVTYRCAKTIVAAAQALVPDFTAHESVPEGEPVTHIQYKARHDEQPYLNLNDLKPGMAVLCRNTRPLVELLYDLLEAGKPVKLEGSTPLQAFVSLVESMGAEDLVVLESKLINHAKEQTTKWQEKAPEKLQRVTDKIDTIMSITKRVQRKGHESVSALLSELRRVFESGQPSYGQPRTWDDRILLTTVHKAKGREWDTVYVLGANLFMPSKYAKRDEDLQQEHNLVYVAITRAKTKLIWIDCRKEDFGAGVPLDDNGKSGECADCGSTGHDTGSNTCPGPRDACGEAWGTLRRVGTPEDVEYGGDRR